MTKPKHTPGPWWFAESANNRFDIGSGDYVHAQTFEPTLSKNIQYLNGGDARANARLIAAAPELKESNEEQQDILYRVIPFLEDLGELDTVYKNGAVAALIRKVKSAIEHSDQALAKAEGKGE